MLDGVCCEIHGGGPRPQKVLVHNYPFEAVIMYLKRHFLFLATCMMCDFAIGLI